MYIYLIICIKSTVLWLFSIQCRSRCDIVRFTEARHKSCAATGARLGSWLSNDTTSSRARSDGVLENTMDHQRLIPLIPNARNKVHLKGWISWRNIYIYILNIYIYINIIYIYMCHTHIYIYDHQMTINDQSLIWRSQKITREVSSFNNHHGFQAYHICHLGVFTCIYHQQVMGPENWKIIKKHKTETLWNILQTDWKKASPSHNDQTILYNTMIIW